MVATRGDKYAFAGTLGIPSVFKEYEQYDHFYFAKHRKYATSLKSFGIDTPGLQVDGDENILKMEATTRQFTIYISDDTSTLSINDEGFVQTLKK